jgi:PGF-pre-PGF domain-containing protein
MLPRRHSVTIFASIVIVLVMITANLGVPPPVLSDTVYQGYGYFGYGGCCALSPFSAGEVTAVYSGPLDTTFDFRFGNYLVSEVRFSTSSAVSGFQISVQGLSYLPPDVPQPGGTPVFIVQFNLGQSLVSLINSAQVTFLFPESWLKPTGLLKLELFTGGNWVQLPLGVFSTYNGYIMFTTTSSGLSLFALVQE